MAGGDSRIAPTTGRQAVGRYGEDLACRKLQSLGMQIIERNWRCRSGEIDIVAIDGGVLVVCEVKTRRQSAYGSPVEAVTSVKVRRLRVLAAQWLATHTPAHRFDDVRIDVIAVQIPTRGEAHIEHVIGVE